MSNRYLRQFQYTKEADTVTLYGSFVVGAAGAVASFQGGGIESVVKESADGQYTITLSDTYNRFLKFDADVVWDEISQVVKIQQLQDPATLQEEVTQDREIVIQCLGPTATDDTELVEANPEEDALIMFRVVLRNSSVGPFDA